MTLTPEQRTAIESGESVSIVVDGTRCVLVRQDVYDETQRLLDFSPRPTYPAVLKALDRDDDPQHYLEYLNE